MTDFILYNTLLKRPLIHPQVGLWSTNDRAEADALLAEFKSLVRDIGRPEIAAALEVRSVKELQPS